MLLEEGAQSPELERLLARARERDHRLRAPTLREGAHSCIALPKGRGGSV
jgi:hypothetical protein